MTRDIDLHRAHPRLRLRTAEVTRVIFLLDTHFRYTAADLPTLTPSARQRARQQARSALPAVPAGSLSLAFFTDAALARLHDDFLQDPTPTDVITFEGDPSFGAAGEVCVSADRAAAVAAAHGHDFATELTLYLVHGWLHLAGYDDLAPAKKRRMRAAEARALRLLQAHQAIPSFSLRPTR